MTFLFAFFVTFAVRSTLCLSRLFFFAPVLPSSAYDFVNDIRLPMCLCVFARRGVSFRDVLVDMKLPLLCVDEVFAPPLRRGERSRPCITFACISYVGFRFVRVGSVRCSAACTRRFERTTLFGPAKHRLVQSLYAATCAAAHATVSVARSPPSLSMRRPAVVCFPATSRLRVASLARRLFSFLASLCRPSPPTAERRRRPRRCRRVPRGVCAVLATGRSVVRCFCPRASPCGDRVNVDVAALLISSLYWFRFVVRRSRAGGGARAPWQIHSRTPPGPQLLVEPSSLDRHHVIRLRRPS